MRAICALLVFLVASFHSFGADPRPGSPLFRFGAVADCQYCESTSKVRKYNLSPKKLTACVEHYNKMELSFVVHLGDFIDRDFASFDKVVPIYNRLNAPHYHVLGNHDFSVADDKKTLVPAKLGLKQRYYDFTRKGWRFIVIDGNDVSLHAWPKDDPRTKAASIYHRSLKPRPPSWNGALGDEQLKWIEAKLKTATKAKERVMLFCHFPVYPKNGHNLWNDKALTSLLARYPCVAAYVNGHNHAGNYGQRDGIHYLTLKGMVDTEQSSYSVIEVYADRLVVKGFGRETNRDLPLPKRP
ncbi:MAG: metallophosphoesterase [Verrucomicrobia bacterium]|nr:metallophosphoesterase [Verrucomicrobiota bacterium]MDA1045974.1 metallophosphoesterase [Verrucomicrobiota bacterium]